MSAGGHPDVKDGVVSPRASAASPNRSVRIQALTGLAVTLPLGLVSRSTAEYLPAWIGAHAGDVLWTVAVFWGFLLLFPRWPALRIALATYGFAIAIELTQLYRGTGWFADIRATTLGRLVFGYAFLWVDPIRYAVGAAAGFLIVRRLRDRSGFIRRDE